MALVCPAVGPAAGLVGRAEVNLVACTSAPLAAADGEGSAQPELQGGLERLSWHARDLVPAAPSDTHPLMSALSSAGQDPCSVSTRDGAVCWRQQECQGLDVCQLSVVAFAKVWLLSDGVDGTLWKANRRGGDVDVCKGRFVCGVD